MIRIGITQRVDTVPGYGERRDALDQRWTDLLGRLGFVPVPIPNRIEDVAGFVTGCGLEGIVLSGGNDLASLGQQGTNVAPERDRTEAALIELCAERGIPILGVCRGLQMLNVHYGGSLSQMHGHVAQSHAISPVGSHGFRFPAEPVNSFHNFGIMPEDLAPGLRPLCRVEDGSIEAVCHDAYPQWGIMWHPERYDTFRDSDLELLQHVFVGVR